MSADRDRVRRWQLAWEARVSEVLSQVESLCENERTLVTAGRYNEVSEAAKQFRNAAAELEALYADRNSNGREPEEAPWHVVAKSR